QRFLERGPRGGVLAHALQNVGKVRQIAGYGELVLMRTRDRERAFGDRKRLHVPSFVPAEQADTPQGVAFERRVPLFAADAQRRAQRSIRRVEPLRERKQVALPQIRFGQPRGRAAWSEVRDQVADDRPLPASETERLARTLLLKEQVRLQVLSRLVIRQVSKPLQDAVEHR